MNPFQVLIELKKKNRSKRNREPHNICNKKKGKIEVEIKIECFDERHLPEEKTMNKELRNLMKSLSDDHLLLLRRDHCKFN